MMWIAAAWAAFFVALILAIAIVWRCDLEADDR